MAVITTERLSLDEWRPDDWPAFREIAGDPEVMRYIGSGATWDDGRARQFVARQIENFQRDGFCLWKLALREGGRLIGQCGLQPLGGTGEVEIGWWLARHCWGRGLATEAARAALAYAFETANLRRVVAIVQPANRASSQVCEKLGMRLERTTTHAELGLPHPEIALLYYAIERDIDSGATGPRGSVAPLA